jgi:hypothetical protein
MILPCPFASILTTLPNDTEDADPNNFQSEIPAEGEGGRRRIAWE